MRVHQLKEVLQRLSQFKEKLDQEGITGFAREVLLRTYIQDISDRINVDKLKVIV